MSVFTDRSADSGKGQNGGGGKRLKRVGKKSILELRLKRKRFVLQVVGRDTVASAVEG